MLTLHHLHQTDFFCIIIPRMCPQSYTHKKQRLTFNQKYYVKYVFSIGYSKTPVPPVPKQLYIWFYWKCFRIWDNLPPLWDNFTPSWDNFLAFLGQLGQLEISKSGKIDQFIYNTRPIIDHSHIRKTPLNSSKNSQLRKIRLIFFAEISQVRFPYNYYNT